MRGFQLMRTFGLASVLAAPAMFLLAATSASAEDDPSNDRKCMVTVDRSREDGVYDVTRQVLSDGSCICYVYTGSPDQSDAIEQQISVLQQRRTCPSAKLVNVPGAGSGSGLGAGTGTGAGSGTKAGLAAAGAMAALGGTVAAAAEKKDNPVSP